MGIVAPWVCVATDVTPHSVLAHANDQQFWIARLDRIGGSTDQTIVYYRLVGQDDKWQKLCQVPARIEQLASQGPLAAALLGDGSWLLIYSDGNTVTAGPLPAASAKMVARWRGENRGVAVGAVAGGLAGVRDAQRSSSTTRPATRKAAASQPQVPASQPSTPGLVVFELAGNEWTPIAQLPEISSELPRVDLALIDEVPHVVIGTCLDRDVIEVLHLHRQKWVRDLHVPGMAQAASFALLADGGSPRLWVQQQSGSDLLFSLTQHGENPLELKPTTDIPAKDRAIALFSGSIRMIGRTTDGMIERRYSLDSGKPEGKPTDLAAASRFHGAGHIQAVQTLVAIAALLLVMLGWFRQQNATDERRTELKSVTLAPLGRRLAAGLIDASPVILTMLIFMVRDRQYAGASIQSRQLLLLLAYWASSFFYIIFTTLVESLGGRSLGKILLGLRVVTMQGQPASTGALVIRNLLRIFDVSFFFLPLLVVVMFPLRQRAADLAAGTLVVINSSADNQGQDGPRVE